MPADHQLVYTGSTGFEWTSQATESNSLYSQANIYQRSLKKYPLFMDHKAQNQKHQECPTAGHK